MSEGTSRLNVEIVNRQRRRRLALTPLRRFLDRLALLEPARPGATELAVAFVSDRRMRRLSRVFRGRDATTDVLSFPGEESWLGDIAISIERAEAQARERGHTRAREIRTLIVHGYLHLNGYDHELDGGRMMRRQRALLTRLERAGRRS